MACTASWSVSSISKSSSPMESSGTSVALYGAIAKATVPQTSSSFFSVSSIFSSFCALSAMSSTSAPNSCSFRSSSPASFRSGSSSGGVNSLPVATISACQWRLRMEGWRSARMSGHVEAKSRTRLSSSLYAGHQRTPLCSCFTRFDSAFASSSSRPGSTSLHAVAFEAFMNSTPSPMSSHMPSAASNQPPTSRSSAVGAFVSNK